MLRAIFTRFGSAPRLLNALVAVPVWVFRVIVHVFRWLRYVYHTRIHPLRLMGRIVPAVVVTGVAYQIGKQILNEEPVKVIILVICIMFVGLVVSRLYIAIGLYMVLLATIFYPSAVPKPITFGGGGLGLAEILLMLILFAAYTKAYGERRHVSSPMTPAVAFLFFAIVLAFGVSYRQYQANPQGFYDFVGAYNYGRTLFPYAIFFGVIYGIRNKRELRLFFNIVFGLASIVGFLMILQYGIGQNHRIFLGSLTGSESVHSLSPEDRDITRILPPGLALVCPLFLTAWYLAATSKIKAGLFYAAAAALMAGGIVLTFARNLWLEMGLALIMALVLSSRQVRWRLAMAMAVVAAAGVMLTLAISIVSPGKGKNLAAALTTRVESILTVKETLNRDTSMEFRYGENRQAWRIIQQHPFFGTGLGSVVTQDLTSKGYMKGFTPVSAIVIHNSWLDTWVHYGICGLVAFAWLSVVFLLRSFRLWRRADEEWVRYMALTFGLYYITWLIRCTVSMMLINHQWEIAAAGLMWGMVEIASVLHIQKPEPQQMRESAAGILERVDLPRHSAVSTAGAME